MADPLIPRYENDCCCSVSSTFADACEEPASDLQRGLGHYDS